MQKCSSFTSINCFILVRWIQSQSQEHWAHNQSTYWHVLWKEGRKKERAPGVNPHRYRKNMHRKKLNTDSDPSTGLNQGPWSCEAVQQHYLLHHYAPYTRHKQRKVKKFRHQLKTDHWYRNMYACLHLFI